MKRTIDTSIWGDPWFTELSATAKMSFMYLLTNERSTAAGLFDLSPRRMAFDIGIDTPDAEKALLELDERVRWWPEHSIVWVINFFRHQAVNDNFLKSAQRTYADLPEEIRQEVVTTYPEFDMNPLVTPPEPVPTGRGTNTHIDKREEGRGKSKEQLGKSDEGIEGNGSDEPAKPKAKRATQVPDDFSVTDALKQWGASQDRPLSVADMESQIPRFVDYYRGKGEPRKDWTRTFHNWMRNAVSYGHLNKTSPQSPAAGRITSISQLFAEDDDHEPEGHEEDSRNTPTSVAAVRTG